MSKYSNFCYYYEFTDHYLGSTRKEAKIPIAKIDEMAEKYASDADSDVIDYEDWVDEIGVYAFHEVLIVWDKVRKDLETKGIWGEEWEEGSHAISMNSMKDARSKVGKLELDVFERVGGW